MPKAAFEVVKSPDRRCFLIKGFDKKGFTAPYHYHPEYELTLIVKGEGKRYVGAHMDQFVPGDLILVGSNMPHCWKLDDPDGCMQAQSVVIHFNEGFMGTGMLDKTEFVYIKKLLQKSSSGMQFTGATRSAIQKQMMQLQEEPDNFNALIGLLQILQTLALSSEYNLLDQHNTMMQQQTTSDQERINKVFAYIVDNFQKEITLVGAANTINMTPNAFCKYFKKVTRKTFMEAVMEFRINYAVQQLVQTDKTISSICYDSGFGDISHFHKTFKSRMQFSPLHYRRRFMQEVGD